MTPDEELARWEELFKAFRRATPSAPDWYQIADHCIGALLHDKIESLQGELNFCHRRDCDMSDAQPKMIPNPLYCDRCEGRGYLVADAEWEPYAVQCDECKDRRPAHTSPNRETP